MFKLKLQFLFLAAVSVFSFIQASAQQKAQKIKYLSKPLISSIYTADPSAHVFNGKIYIYPSHDIDAGIPENDNGDHFAMRDYHILSLDYIGGPVTDHGVALDIKDIAWAGRQLWAPDAAYKTAFISCTFLLKINRMYFKLVWPPQKHPPARLRHNRIQWPAAIALTLPFLLTMTEALICISAVSGAASCSAGKTGNTMQMAPKLICTRIIHPR